MSAYMYLTAMLLCHYANIYAVTNTNCIAPGTLRNQPDTYLVPVNYNVGLGVWHIDAYYIYQ